MTSWHKENENTEFHPESGIRLCEECGLEITLANTRVATRARTRICGKCYLKLQAEKRRKKGLK